MKECNNNFYNTIIKNTTYEVVGKNILIQSIDFENEPINYIIKTENFNNYCKKIIEYAFINGEIELEEIQELLFKDIFKVYKTKVATKRISLLLLYYLTIKDIFFSADGIKYIVIKEYDHVFENFKNIFV